MAAPTGFKRLLLKLSGELLAGKRSTGLEPDAVRAVAATVKHVHDAGVELALVIGAGNLVRGAVLSGLGMARPQADRIGMLATVMNALALQDALEHDGLSVVVMTPTPITGAGEAFDQRRAEKHLGGGTVVIFAGGTGHPFFTTDTTAALRACEIGADAIFKATKVDGVYSDDPLANPEATRFPKLTYEDAIKGNLKVMDATAFSLCRDNRVPILVFRYADAGIFNRLLAGDFNNATYVGND